MPGMPPNIPNIAAPGGSVAAPNIGGGFAPPNIAGFLKAIQPNPLLQLLQAAGQFPQQQNQAQLDKLQIQQSKQAIEQGDWQLQQAKQQTLDQQWAQLGSTVKANPNYAQDPTLIAKAQQLAKERGVPVPLDANGHIDTNVFKTPYDSLDEATKQKLAQAALERAPGPARDAMLADYSGVPPELRTGPQSFAAKDQAALSRAQSAGLHADAEDHFLEARTAHLKAMEQPGTPEYNQEVAKTAKYQADASAALQNAKSKAVEAQAATTRAQAAMTTAQNRGLGGNVAIRTAVGDTLRLSHELQTQIDGLDENIVRLSQVADDPSTDPQIQELIHTKEALKAQLAGLQTSTQAAQDWISNNVGAARTAQQQSGKQTSASGAWNPPPGYKQGTDKNGRQVWGKPNAPGTPLYDANGNVVDTQ